MLDLRAQTTTNELQPSGNFGFYISSSQSPDQIPGDGNMVNGLYLCSALSGLLTTLTAFASHITVSHREGITS